MAGETIAVIGTLDSKGAEYAFLKKVIEAQGVRTLVIDCGVYGNPPFVPAIPASEVARAGGETLEALAAASDRGSAMDAMSRGARIIVRRLHEEGRIQGAIAMGGGGGTTIGSIAMRDLPVGVPKLIVSTLASGDISPFVGTKDITVMPAVVDVAGINRLSGRIIANAAGAIAGMVKAGQGHQPGSRPMIAATMFGVTTPAVTRAREILEGKGYEVLVFHAVGSGGRTMEDLIRSGYFEGVLDLTTTELADELCGGILSAGPNRLEAAGETGTPQVVSLGAMDMVNFGARDTVPPKYEHRRLYQHNPLVTLMRTTIEENAELGRIVAGKLNRATGPTMVMIPRKGVSSIAVEGKPFHDPRADEALFEALRTNLDAGVKIVEMDTDINDPAFAAAAVEHLLSMMKDRQPSSASSAAESRPTVRDSAGG